MYGRIPDEKKMFEPGDTFMYEGLEVVVEKIVPHRVYYEHRPIASYQAYYYVVTRPDGTSRTLSIENIFPED
jgi:hypothetical protein